jgi:hypothetical protein
VIVECAAAWMFAQLAGRHADVFGDEAVAKRASRDADAAGDRFKEIFGVTPLRAAIVVAKERPADASLMKGGAKWIWSWSRKTGDDPDGDMMHELGHMWFIFWVDGTSRPKAKVYGSSLPDWIDEGVATLFDTEKTRAWYRRSLRSRLDDAPSLDDFFACVHPDSREKGAEERRAKDRGQFYGQAHSVTAYLLEKGELRKAIATMRQGRAVATDFEKSWREWAARDE